METPDTIPLPAGILIAEDSLTQAERLRYVLEREGYSVRTARNGREALALLRAERPALVISDVLMPGMDGYELCQAIKANPDWHEIPVVLVTTLTSPQDVVKGLECGADNFIRKPYDEGYLISRVRYIVANCELRAREREATGVGFEVGVAVQFRGRRYLITSERQQILDLLISTYEQAVQVNEELAAKERALRRSYQSLSALYRLAVDLNRARDEAAVVDAALQGVLGMPGLSAAWIVLRDGAGFRCAGQRGLPEAADGACDCHLHLLDAGGWGVRVVDCAWLAAAGGPAGPSRHASLRLQGADAPPGVIHAALEGATLAEDEMTMLEGVAHQVATALERVRLLEHLERNVRERTARLQAEVAERQRAETQVRQLNAELERRVVERTAELAEANRELEAFSYSVSHDLRAPLRAVGGFGEILLADYAAALDATGREYVERLRAATVRMGQLIEDLLQLSRVTRQQLNRQPVDLSELAEAVVGELRNRDPGRRVHCDIAERLTGTGDARLLRVLLENLFGNAWKYTGQRAEAHIEFGVSAEPARGGGDDRRSAIGDQRIFFIRDDGAGFDMAYAHKLFAPFQRLHSAAEFEGTGVGLATARRIINRHGGRIWAEAAVDRGATFYFTLPPAEAAEHQCHEVDVYRDLDRTEVGS